VGHRVAAARSAQGLQFGRRGLAVAHGVEGGTGPQRVALHGLVHAFDEEGVGDRVGRVGEIGEDPFERGEFGGGRGGHAHVPDQVEVTGGPQAAQAQAVDHVVGGDGFADRAVVVEVGGGGGGEGAEVVGPGGEGADRVVLQRAFEAVAEQGAQRLAPADAVEQPGRGAGTVRGQVDGGERVRRVAVGALCGAQHGGGGGLGEGRGVHGSGGVGGGEQLPRRGAARLGQRVGPLPLGALGEGNLGRRGLAGRHVEEPAVAAEVAAGRLRGARAAEPSEAAGGQGGDPGVQPVGGGVQGLGEQPLQFHGGQVGERLERVHRLVQGLEFGPGLGVGRPQVGGHGGGRAGPHPLGAAPHGRGALRVVGVDQFRLAPLGRAGAEDEVHGAGVLREEGVPGQAVQQRGGQGGAEVVAPAGPGQAGPFGGRGDARPVGCGQGVAERGQVLAGGAAGDAVRGVGPGVVEGPGVVGVQHLGGAELPGGQGEPAGEVVHLAGEALAPLVVEGERAVPPQRGDVVGAQRAAAVDAPGEGRHAEDLGDGALGGGAPGDPGDGPRIGRGGRPDPVAQGAQEAGDGRIEAQGAQAGALDVRPAVERQHGQDAVRLGADPQGGQRSAGAQVTAGVLAGAADLVVGEAVLAELAQVVAPGGAPQGGGHGAGGGLVAAAAVAGAGQRSRAC
jgi:hypothetical protein